MPVPLLMDVDTGIDDALALLLATRCPEVELLGVGTVAGNVDASMAARNTLRALEVAGASSVPVAVGAAAPLLEPFQDATWVHGEDGLGNSSQPEPSGSPSDEHAVEQILRLSREYAFELTIVAVGPLTNLALALRVDPGVAARIGRVVIMGGSARTGGNVGAWTEANIGHDPEAAAAVFEADLPRTMIGLDVTTRVGLGDDEVSAFAASRDPAAELAAAILPHYLGVYEVWSGQRRCALHDPLAVAVAARPELIVTHSMNVRVETAGRLTRGMTVADLRGLMPVAASEPRSTDVALEVHVEAFQQMFHERMTARARS